MSSTNEQTVGKRGNETKVYEVKGIASFPFSIHMEAENAEEADQFTLGLELMDLLLGLNEDEYDEVKVKKVTLLEDEKPFNG